MNTIIGAEAARWAGLQIDLNQKYRAGHITADHLEWFNGLRKDIRDRFAAGEPASKPTPPAEPTEKFTLLTDLGIITVPDGYDHATQLASFSRKNRKKFYYYNDNNDITDEHFPNPTRILKAGDKFHVRAFKQITSGTTTSEERLAFLATQKAVYTGAQGASLVFEQKREELPKGRSYISFDEKERLWKEAGGYHRVPHIIAGLGGDFGFNLGYFEDDWGDSCCLLSFRDAEPVQGE